jgi:hypothetical protein
MGALILTGSVLAYVVTPSAGQIGIASAVAFFASESVDGIVYQACIAGRGLSGRTSRTSSGPRSTA